jgi:signal transduction histidine kinase
MFAGVENFINIIGILGILAIIAMAMMLASKIDKVKQLQTTVDKLKKSFDEMDEQAKLIVRTDMELNKIQEELDKKIVGLYALQRLSRAISTSLEERQIFKMIAATHLQELGFEKAAALLWSEKEKRFLIQANIGYLSDEVEAIKSYVDLDKDRYLELINNERALCSIEESVDGKFKQKVNKVFKVDSFVIAPILPKEGNKGFLFVGTQSPDILIDVGDEELITILANQLGQALENARLFEKTWRTQQDLENKVEERTRELTGALNEVKTINSRKTDFVSSVSHELRTPLTSIKGYASILLTGKLGEVPLDIRERLEKINRHSDELVHMVDDLLDIARIESGRVTMKREPLDLKIILEKVSDLLSVQLKDKQIEFTWKINAGAGTVLADRSQMERVLINLIGNAIKFIPLKGKISVQAQKSDKTVQVDCIDTGCGIPEDSIEKIFEEFYRVDNPINQEAKGTGLGLSLVKHIIEAHQGKIWVTSKLNQGSTFSFTLPAPT